MNFKFFNFNSKKQNENQLAKMIRRFKNIIFFSGFIIIVTEVFLIGIIILYMAFFGSNLIKKEEVKYLNKDQKVAFENKLIYRDEYGEFYFKCAFPIAKKFNMDYSDSFGVGRSYGPGGTNVTRKHEGIDIFGDEGTPIIAVESGTIINIGWNEMGGWRINILNDDNTRSWYYAHLRKIAPYAKGIKKGYHVEFGEVIGYMGSTGYSNKIAKNTMPEKVVNKNNIVDTMFPSHLHIGIYDKSGGSNPQNPYPILQILESNRIEVLKSGDEYIEIESFKKVIIK